MTTKEELLGRARELAPVFASRALGEEAQRTIGADTVRDLRDAEFLKVLTPKVYGGLELGLDAMADIVRIIAAACPSTGWVSAFYMGAAWRSLFYCEAGQREIFLLRHDGGLSLAEVADSLELALPTVKTQFARAALKLQAKLAGFRPPDVRTGGSR